MDVETVTLLDLGPIIAAILGPMLAFVAVSMRYQHNDTAKTRHLIAESSRESRELIAESSRENRELIEKSSRESRELIEKSSRESRELIEKSRRESRELIEESRRESRELIEESRRESRERSAESRRESRGLIERPTGQSSAEPAEPRQLSEPTRHEVRSRKGREVSWSPIPAPVPRILFAPVPPNRSTGRGPRNETMAPRC